MRKRIIQSRMSEQHMQRQSLHAFNQISRNRLFRWRLPKLVIMVRAGQVITSTHQRLINMAIDSMGNYEHISLPNLVTDNEDQESIHDTPNFEVQDESIIKYIMMHNITIMTFPDEVISQQANTTDCAHMQ
jgi:hypothetical protein